MDWTALWLSLHLALWTLILLLPVSILGGRALAFHQFRSKVVLEALVMLPLVLPPTVFGFYLLVAFGGNSPMGQIWRSIFGHQLVFSFEGLVLASVIFNIPFAVQPAQRAFEAIPVAVREAARCCGMSPFQAILRIELPLAWPGILTGMALTFAHTLGEFGIVLMVGGSIPGQTKTIAIAIYDRVQAFDFAGANLMAAVLFGISLGTISLTFWLSSRMGRRLS
jgi:molybdate transport system permease protein